MTRQQGEGHLAGPPRRPRPSSSRPSSRTSQTSGTAQFFTCVRACMCVRVCVDAKRSQRLGLALRTDRPTRVLVTHHAACFSPHDGKCVCSDAFDPAQAKREGIIKPRPGVDPQHDDVGLRLIRGCLIYLPFSPVGPPPPSRPSIVHSPARPIQQAKAAIAGVKAELDAYLKESASGWAPTRSSTGAARTRTGASLRWV